MPLKRVGSSFEMPTLCLKDPKYLNFTHQCDQFLSEKSKKQPNFSEAIIHNWKNKQMSNKT